MVAKVAVVQVEHDYQEPLKKALGMVGGIGDINTVDRNVVFKLGVFHPRSRQHASADLVHAIVECFDRAPSIFLAESDNYCGKSLDRLQIYSDLFSNRVVPVSLSDDAASKRLKIAGEEMSLSHVLFKPNVFVNVHVLRNFQRGIILKNLFGCTPTIQKSRYHKNEVFCRLLADIYEAVGGVDLAVVDGSHLFHAGTDVSVPTNILVVGRDAVAVETVAATLAGLKPERLEYLQEFVRRGLGEGNIDNIEVVGAPFEQLEAKFKTARKELKTLYNNRPRTPGISKTIDVLIEEGWMDGFRRVSEVVNELKRRGVTNATVSVVSNTLRRRAVTPEQGRIVERARHEGEWVYYKKRH